MSGDQPDPHFAVGGLAMAATLACRDLDRRDVDNAKRTLEDALKRAQPHMTPELRDILKDAR